MKDAIALQSLQKIAANYAEQAKEIKNLRRKVRELTAQRDRANARNAALRDNVVIYRAALAEARSQRYEAEPSAWAGVRLEAVAA